MNSPKIVTNPPKNGQLKVWWIPQVPGKSFEVWVDNLAEAKLLLKTLGDYDLFQLKNRIKPDYCNIGGISIWDTECPDENGDCWVSYDDLNEEESVTG